MFALQLIRGIPSVSSVWYNEGRALIKLPQQCNDLMSVHLWNAYKLSEKTCHHLKRNTFDEFEGRCSQISSSVRKWASLSTNLLASPNKWSFPAFRRTLAPCTFWALILADLGTGRWIEQGKEDLMLLSNLYLNCVEPILPWSFNASLVRFWQALMFRLIISVQLLWKGRH